MQRPHNGLKHLMHLAGVRQPPEVQPTTNAAKLRRELVRCSQWSDNGNKISDVGFDALGVLSRR